MSSVSSSALYLKHCSIWGMISFLPLDELLQLVTSHTQKKIHAQDFVRVVNVACTRVA